MSKPKYQQTDQEILADMPFVSIGIDDLSNVLDDIERYNKPYLLVYLLRDCIQYARTNVAPTHDMNNAEASLLQYSLFRRVQGGVKVNMEKYVNKIRDTSTKGRDGGIKSGLSRASNVKPDEAVASCGNPNEANINLNTNININTSDNKEIKGIANRNTTPLLEGLKDMLEEDFQGISKSACIRITEYFLEQYRINRSEEHPEVSFDTLNNLASKLGRIDDSDNYVCFDDFDEDEFIAYNYEMIDKYFVTEFPDCDYRIMHYLSGDIRKNRFYEIGMV